MADLIISVSGLRGVVGESLDPVVAVQFAGAWLEGLEAAGPVVVGRDGRATGPMLWHAVVSAIQASGRDVLDAGPAATPTVGLLVRHHRAAGGIQISASHNPPQWNGLKLFGADGRVIPAAAGQKVIGRYHEGRPRWAGHDALGSVDAIADPVGPHLEAVLATVNSTAIRQKKFRVVLDSNHGAGAVAGVRLLRELGCEVTCLGAEPDGQFEHPPEPTADNLRGVAQRAAAMGADVVFCQDPDADRLAILDESGRYIGEEFTLALVLDHVLRTRPGHVVTNCSTSRMAADLAARHGCTFSLSAVGEANVTDEMIARGAVYGGEGNGGPIDPRVGLVRDSLVGMAQVLDLLAARQVPLSAAVATLPQYAIHKTTVAVARPEVPRLLDALRREFPDARAGELDGLRLDWDDRWLLVRPSNTEPIVRAVAEAPSAEAARELCERVAKLVPA